MQVQPLNRRHWIRSAVSATAMTALGGGLSRGMESAGDPAVGRQSAVPLVADLSKNLYRVKLEMEIEGNIKLPRNPLVSKETASRVPVRSQATLDWEERVLGFAEDRTGHVAERYYHSANSSGTVGKREQTLTLRPQSRLLRIRREDQQWQFHSPDSYLDGQELELVQVPASSLAVDGLLPTAAVAEGDSYQPDREVLAKLLSLAAVQSSTVEGQIHKLESESAQIHFKGKVEGSVSGVPTTIDLVAKLTFDREQQVVTWLVLAIREHRETGKLKPGFEIAGTIRMIRKPLSAPVRLPATAADDWDREVPAERLLTELNSPAVGYAVLMDRRWKIMTDVAGASMMRMIDNDLGVAQCNLRPLGKMAAGAQLTLEAFVAQSQRSMGERFSEVLQSREEVNESGLRVLRATIQGVVQGVPVQWIFVQFSDDHGRRLLATITIGNDHLDTFAGADEQLARSLRFLPLNDETFDVASQAAPRTGVQ